MAAKGQVLLASGINLIAGLWLIVVPFFYDFGSLGATVRDFGTSPEARATGNMMVVGFAIAVLAAIRLGNAYQAAGYQRPTMWLSWLNVLLGLWLIVAPFILGYADITGAFWNSIIVGVIVAVPGAWSALLARAVSS
jgi:hypothetical protein